MEESVDLVEDDEKKHCLPQGWPTSWPPSVSLSNAPGFAL